MAVCILHRETQRPFERRKEERGISFRRRRTRATRPSNVHDEGDGVKRGGRGEKPIRRQGTLEGVRNRRFRRRKKGKKGRKSPSTTCRAREGSAPDQVPPRRKTRIHNEKKESYLTLRRRRKLSSGGKWRRKKGGGVLCSRRRGGQRIELLRMSGEKGRRTEGGEKKPLPRRSWLRPHPEPNFHEEKKRRRAEGRSLPRFRGRRDEEF